MATQPAVTVKALERLDEMARAEALHRIVFKRPEPYPAEELLAIHRAGGLVLGGFLGPKMVGFAVALMTLGPAGRSLFGRVMGVLREHRDLGLGRLFKVAQRDYGIGQGLERMEWVFSPLVARTAHFHLTSIGGVCRAYDPSYHLSTGGRSGPFAARDRLLVTWELASERVEARLAGQRPPLPEGAWTTRIEVKEGLPRLAEAFLDRSGPRLLVEIPFDLYAYESCPEVLIPWRQAVGEILERYVNREGYVVTECFGPVVEGLRRPFYLLERP